MNELTIGWWIVPASIPTLVFGYAAMHCRKDKDNSAYLGGVVITIIAIICALLARIL